MTKNNMTVAQALEHISNGVFGLRDFKKTEDRRGNYHSDKHIEIESNITGNGAYHHELEQFIFEKFHNRTGRLGILREQAEKDGLSKSRLKQVRTQINQLTIEYNRNYCEWYLNDDGYTVAKNHSFEKKFYVHYYEEINEAMQTIMEDIIKEFE